MYGCCRSIGINLVGFSSALFAVAPCLPGLFARLMGRELAASETSTSPIVVTLSHIYDCAWFSSVALAAACYILLSQCVPSYQQLPAVGTR
eukprot:COSAG02_NODE_16540_length_1075_cov_95.378074_1_plen_90_part_10